MKKLQLFNLHNCFKLISLAALACIFFPGEEFIHSINNYLLDTL